MITNEILAILEHVLPPPSYQCGGTGWTPVALINMTNTNQQCPSELNLTSYSSAHVEGPLVQREHATQHHSVLEA